MPLLDSRAPDVHAFTCGNTDRRQHERLPPIAGGTKAEHYSAVLHCIGNRHSWSDALQAFEKLKKWDVAPDASAYRSLLAACERDGQWAKGLELVEEMKQAGHKVTAGDYATVMNGCMHHQNWEMALEIFSGLLEAGPRPDRAARLVALDACALGGAWEMAMSVLADLRAGQGPDDGLRMYRPAVGALVRAGQWHQALDLLEELKVEGPAPDAALFASAYSCMARACMQEADEQAWERALHLLEALAPLERSCELMLLERELRKRLPHHIPRRPVSSHTTSYIVSVRTTDIEHAGTDAVVFVVLYNEEGQDTGHLILEDSEFNQDPFERNKVDEFTITGPWIGDVVGIKIGHDNSGLGADWHCEKVSIEAPEYGKVWNFLCNRWFSARRDDYLSERHLKVHNVDESRSAFIGPHTRGLSKDAPEEEPGAPPAAAPPKGQLHSKKKPSKEIVQAAGAVADERGVGAAPGEGCPEEGAAQEEDEEEDGEPIEREPTLKR
eukprot:CAMPEP_0204152272 /NCGR_PEP_ID=MMETSP0361-20130328/26871_1 /ASSEMBLY_ACC=CAM_ASM_000343 /TAXON_ID=268821 /ORGANISM="Scrippsiella Hangoei, Strain SHTV-5" /LENGTH=496 /DNA_ID=CAMNT_0051107203 /DNA_START=34 /DNA_END=1521 /DNA_ORIENTATION=+